MWSYIAQEKDIHTLAHMWSIFVCFKTEVLIHPYEQRKFLHIHACACIQTRRVCMTNKLQKTLKIFLDINVVWQAEGNARTLMWSTLSGLVNNSVIHTLSKEYEWCRIVDRGQCFHTIDLSVYWSIPLSNISSFHAFLDTCQLFTDCVSEISPVFGMKLDVWCVVFYEQLMIMSCVEPDSSLVEHVPRNPFARHMPLIPRNHGVPYFQIQKIFHGWIYSPKRSLEQLLVINFYATFWCRDIRMYTFIICTRSWSSFWATSQLPQDLNLRSRPFLSCDCFFDRRWDPHDEIRPILSCDCFFDRRWDPHD